MTLVTVNTPNGLREIPFGHSYNPDFWLFRDDTLNGQLYHAVGTKDKERVKELFEKGADPTYRFNQIFKLVLLNGDIEMVKLFHEYCKKYAIRHNRTIDMNSGAVIKEYSWLLATVAMTGNLEIFMYLVEECGWNVHVDAKPTIGANGAEELVPFHSEQVFVSACSYGWIDIVHYIMDHSKPGELNLDYNNGEALVSACRHGHTKIVVLLIGSGATHDIDNHKPLKEASANGHEDTLDELITNSDTYSAIYMDCDCFTEALNGACTNGHIGTSRRLLIEDAMPNSPMWYDPLLASVTNNKLEILKMLVENYNALFESDSTHKYLAKAIQYNNFEIFQYLLFQCTQLKPENRSLKLNQTLDDALEWAFQRDDKFLTALISYGVNFNKSYSFGRPLTHCIKEGQLSKVKLLLELEAQSELAMEENVMTALENKKWDVCEYLFSLSTTMDKIKQHPNYFGYQTWYNTKHNKTSISSQEIPSIPANIPTLLETTV